MRQAVVGERERERERGGGGGVVNIGDISIRSIESFWYPIDNHVSVHEVSMTPRRHKSASNNAP